MRKFKSVWELKDGGETGRMGRDKELKVGLRSDADGNFGKEGREFEYEQLCHKAGLAERILLSRCPVFPGTF